MKSKRACDVCHKRKIQCGISEAGSSCNWCSHHELTCTFDRVRGRKPRNTKTKRSSEKTISQRIKRVEYALATVALAAEGNKGSPSTSNTSTPPFLSGDTPITGTSSAQSISLGEQVDTNKLQQIRHSTSTRTTSPAKATSRHIHFAGYHLGQVSCHNGIPFLSEEGQRWIFSRTGEWGSFPNLDELGARHQLSLLTSPAMSTRTVSSLLRDMPSRSIIEKLLNDFRQSIFKLIFPIIDPVLFLDMLDLAYAPFDEQSSLETISARACVLAFIPFMSLFRPDAILDIDIDTDEYALKASHLLSDILEDGSLTSLQTLLMLHMHHVLSGRLQSAAILHAVACRTVLMLGGHNSFHVQPFGTQVNRQEREARHLRTLFWLCYIFDKDISLRIGQPPLLTDEYCDLTLPDRYEECQFVFQSLADEEVSPRFADEELVPHLPGDIRLSILKGKIYRLLYSVAAFKKSETDLLRNIRELDDELESWRLSLPADTRPALFVAKNSRFDARWKVPLSTKHILLHLEYHHIMSAIHRASGRCRTRQENSETQLGGVIESSLLLSVEASRSTLLYLRAAVKGLAGEAFWAVVFYPMSALMTLFCNILMNPLTPQASADLELLGSAMDLIRSMPIRRLRTYEIGHIQMMDDFFRELIRLGTCAIAKAENSKDATETQSQIPMRTTY